ncbi:hypothetical protein MKK70_25270 [Methylobacterium sp. E-041]|uniref:hypothetical protein n=1 Tax=Methylobacterium sp. E-041 TaxID=2836573 RepID=UPI001FBB44D5|nr:hypothetical protein [Methylobacterium sp. E-041]MCJ2108623.1 hypothetical protein [Methylobacterium sp. E-041]
MRSEDLPGYLRKRIEIDAGREDATCWHWTGKFKAARQRYRPYASALKHPELRQHTGRFTTEAGMPKVRLPGSGKEEDAHRRIYGEATLTPICDVPTLQRCANPRCVSPWHVVPGVLTAAQRKRLVTKAQPAAEPVAETLTDDEMMALLKAVDGGEGVATWVSKDSAADEAGIPREQLTDEVWNRYCIENPEDDDA